jgi:dihydroorotate dehydrogenase
MRILELQGRTHAGRELFRLLSYGRGRVPVSTLGLTFPSPFGTGPDIDVDGRASAVLQYLGCGFLNVGPVSLQGRPRVRALDRARLITHRALARSTHGHAASAAEVRISLPPREVVEVPISVVVDDDDPAAVIAALEDRADIFSLRFVMRTGGGRAQSAVRTATSKPLLARIPLDGDASWVCAQATRARDAGFDGVVIADGELYAGLPDGRIDAAASIPRVLEAVFTARKALGRDYPIIAAGGMLTPEDARACLAAGATLVEISSGLVYSGPGIIGRALELPPLRTDRENRAEKPMPPGAVPLRALQLWTALALVAGIALGTVPTRWLTAASALAPWVFSSGAVASSHAAAGALVLLGSVCAATTALTRRGARWTSWLVMWVVAAAIPLSLALSVAGFLALVAGELSGDAWLRRGFRAFFVGAVPAWRWSAANLGRRCVQASAVIVAALALSCPRPGRVPLGMALAALSVAWLAQRGLAPGVRPLWHSLVACGGGLIAIALSIRDVAWQTVTAAISLGLMAAGLAWLRRPLVQLDEGSESFPDV